MPGLPCDRANDGVIAACPSDILLLCPPPALLLKASDLISDPKKRMLLHHQPLQAAKGPLNDVVVFDDVNRARSPDHRQALVNDDNVAAAGAPPPFDYGSAESEHDLAAMVHDFMENGSYGSEFPESSDGENSVVNGPKLFETLQALKFNSTTLEKELVSLLTLLASSIKEIDLVCLRSGADCKGGCIRRLLVKHLRLSGFDAAVCTSKWPNSGRVPGGEYEYIDVTVEDESGLLGRLIVDIDFRSQFEIARPTHSYVAALKFLPGIFVGSEAKLGQILQVMAEAGKLSLRQNSMPLPPWRTLDYMTVKWMSPPERNLADEQGLFKSRSSGIHQWGERMRTKQCMEQLRHLKLGINPEPDKTHIGKSSSGIERNRALFLARSLRAVTGTLLSEKN